MIWSFTLHLKGADDTEDLANAIYDAGGSDATVSSRAGRVVVGFDREGPTLDQAIKSAIENIRSAGVDVDHVSIDVVEVSSWLSA